MDQEYSLFFVMLQISIIVSFSTIPPISIGLARDQSNKPCRLVRSFQVFLVSDVLFLVMFACLSVCSAWLQRVEEERFVSAEDQELRTDRWSESWRPEDRSWRLLSKLYSRWKASAGSCWSYCLPKHLNHIYFHCMCLNIVNPKDLTSLIIPSLLSLGFYHGLCSYA